MDWCKKTLPDKPVWLTEFGWDTYSTASKHSYVFAPAPQQANYIIRSYFVALKMGFEKAFLFMDKDPDSDNTLQYSSSGIISDQVSGLTKKPSFYYLATLQNVLGSAVLDSIESYRLPTGNNEVFCFKFMNGNNESVYAIWTRVKNSKTDSGTTLNYSLDLGYQPEYANLITLKDKDLDGVKTSIGINGKTLQLNLSETPQFVVVAANKTSSNLKKEWDLNFNIYPNPAGDFAEISFNNPVYQKVKVSVFSADGKLHEIVSEGYLQVGKQFFKFGEKANPGIYFVSVNAVDFKEVKKVIIQKN
jgi:hypothetical protein